MKRIALGLVLITACAPAAGPEELGSTTSNISTGACGAALNDVDGIFAYSNGANEGTGDSCGGVSADGTYLYQCVEFAQRYFHARFGTQLRWNVAAAAQMCNANPAGTTVHWIGSGYRPKHGDLIVWQGGTYGHVAVVKSASDASITIVEQNGGMNANGTRTLYPGDNYGWAGCFVSGNGNPGATTTTGTTGTCAYGDGLYCGGNGGGSDPNTLYRCTGGTPAVEERCANGCEKRPYPENDRCGGVKAAAPSCPNGYGLYCGGNGVSGDASTLYDCQPSGITVAQVCATGCARMPATKNDECN